MIAWRTRLENLLERGMHGGIFHFDRYLGIEVDDALVIAEQVDI
jgi:hypothetical protein